jgi:hypothetical protein
MATAELKVRIDAETGRLKKGLQDANSGLTGFAKNTSALMGTVAASIAGAFSVGAVIGFTKEVFNATAQFQKFEAVLGNTLGSSALAGLKLKEIQEFAAKTPFGVNELTNSFVKLANQGFKPTGDQMRLLGDLASSTGKSFDQLSEAIIDAQVGEFERLKEFGIRAQDAGDKVIFTFKGIQTQVDKSSSSIREYITSLGNAEGVSGSMAVISETLTGKISNLGDSWDQMLISIGNNTSGVFSSVIGAVAQAIDKITEFNNELEVQSKFKIGGSFAKRFFTSTEFDGVEISNNKKAIDTIISLDKATSKFTSDVISGAKSVTDFGNAIAKLKAEGDVKLKDSSILGKEAQAGIKDTYENAIRALQDGRKAFQAELNAPEDAGFGKGVGKELKTTSDILKALSVNFKQIGADFSITFGKGNEERVGALKKAINELISIGADSSIIQKLQSQLLSIDPSKITEKGKEVGVNAAVGIEQGLASIAPVISKNLGENLKGGLTEWQTYVNNDLLPKVQTNFETFFNDILMRGKLSFESLGKAILNTFLSIAASDAARGLTNLFKFSGGAGYSNNLGSKVSGLAAIGKALGIGGGAAAGAAVAAGSLSGVAASTGGVILGSGVAAAGTAGAGTAGALATGTAATGGLLLPILGGIAAGALVASLFKKKQPTQPTPAFTTSNAISTSSSSNVDFGNGRVVFEISGVNLVGVLNRAGAKLQRFGP